MDDKLKKIFAICFYAFFINGVTALIFGAIMPEILGEFELGYDTGGLLLSVQSVGNLIASFIGGVVSVYLGRKTAIMVLSSMSVIGFFSLSLITAPWFLFLPFFLTGIGRGSVTNIGNTIINEEGDSQAGPLNLLHTFFAFGAFLTPLFAAWALGQDYSWRFILQLIGGLAIILVFVFSRLPIENVHRGRMPAAEASGGVHFLSSIDFYLASGILFFYVGVEYAVNGWIVTYLKDSGIMTTTMAQRILSLLWIIIIFGRLFIVSISRRVDKRTILLASSIGTMVFFGLFLLASGLGAIIGCILGLGFCLSSIYPTTISNIGPVLRHSSLAMGTLLGVAGLGGIVMPYLVGLVANKQGIAGGMVAIAIAIGLLFGFTLINRLRSRSEPI